VVNSAAARLYDRAVFSEWGWNVIIGLVVINVIGVISVLTVIGWRLGAAAAIEEVPTKDQSHDQSTYYLPLLGS
jgi:hypothetical protein